MKRRAVIKIKTRKQLRLTRKGSRPRGWNVRGEMDYLFGRTIKATIDDRGDAYIAQKGSKSSTKERWWINFGEFEVIREIKEK